MNTMRLLLMILLTICQVPVKKKVTLDMTGLTYGLKQIFVSLVRANNLKYSHNCKSYLKCFRYFQVATVV